MHPGALVVDENTVLQIQHDSTGLPLARVGAGTLSFRETPNGLEFSATLPESAVQLRESLERGDMNGSVSIGFICDDDQWTHTENQSMREVTSGRLLELSLVVAGCYVGARTFNGGKANG